MIIMSYKAQLNGVRDMSLHHPLGGAPRTHTESTSFSCAPRCTPCTLHARRGYWSWHWSRSQSCPSITNIGLGYCSTYWATRHRTTCSTPNKQRLSKHLEAYCCDQTPTTPIQPSCQIQPTMDADLVTTYDNWRLDGAYDAETSTIDWAVTQPLELLLEPVNATPLDAFLAQEGMGSACTKVALLEDDMLHDIAIDVEDLVRGTSLDIPMLDACPLSATAPAIPPFVKDAAAASAFGGPSCDAMAGSSVPSTSCQGGNNDTWGCESCGANNAHHPEPATPCAATPTSMQWQQESTSHAASPLTHTDLVTAVPELAKLPPGCVQLLMGQPWVMEHVMPLLTGCVRLTELGRQVLDALGAASYQGLQGRDLEASAQVVVTYINVWCLVEACTAACSHVSIIASTCFLLIKNSCWSQWVQGGSSRARTNSNTVKQARRVVAMEGLTAAWRVMQRVYEGVQQGHKVEKVVTLAGTQLQVVADHLWDRKVTSLQVQGALQQLQLVVDKIHM